MIRNMEKAVEVLMDAKCTRHDAERHIRNGSTVFEGIDEYMQFQESEGFLPDLMESTDCATREEFRDKVLRGEVEDVEAVKHNGMTCIIEYWL